jgi:hypothetical protein
MQFLIVVFFLVGLTVSVASDLKEKDVEEVSHTPVSAVMTNPELLTNVLSFVRDKPTFENAARVARLWRGCIMQNICFFWDQHGQPVEVKLTRQNVLTWLKRFACVPTPLLNRHNVFSSLDNAICALSAFSEDRPGAFDFFGQLDRAEIWRLTWPLQNQAILFQNDPELRALHQRLLRNLLDIADIPTLYPEYERVYNETVGQGEPGFNPAEASRLFQSFCETNERRIFIVQLLNRLNFTQLLFRNGHIIARKPWGEAERQQYYCPIEARHSLCQYVVDSHVQDGVDSPAKVQFRVLLEKQTINMDDFRREHRVVDDVAIEKPLFEVTVKDFHLLDPLCHFMTLRSLHGLLDRKVVQTLIPDLTPQGMQTLYKLKKERYLRTRNTDDLKFITIYEKAKPQ